MQKHRLVISAAIVLAIFVIGIPSMTPGVHAAAKPCNPSCAIAILSPGSGGALNNNQNVNPTFLVSFLVHNFTLVSPGTTSDINTTTTGPGAKPNEGHIHVFVDNAYLTIWTSLNRIPLTLTSGSHTVRLDLVNDLHQEFSPGINASTTVNVVDTTQSNASSAQSNAANAMYFSLGPLVVSIITLILVAYVAFKPKSKGM